MNENSAQSCGCDAGANWTCERHRKEAEDVRRCQGSHYTPFFTRRSTDINGTVYEETACGQFVGWSEVSQAHEEPTCQECRIWLGLKDEDKVQ